MNMASAKDQSGVQVEELVLLRIDEACFELQQEGKYLDALEYMQRSFMLRRCLYGDQSPEAVSKCKELVDALNGLATAYLQSDDFNMAMKLIKKAEAITETYEFLRAVTYNNLACYYRRQGKFRAALKYLEKALKLNSKSQETTLNRASTHLNLCAVLSQLGRHAVALEQALQAVIILQEDLFAAVVSTQKVNQTLLTKAVVKDKVAVLAIAYHNCGVEQEYLKRWDSCLEYYAKAYDLAESHLGQDHEVARSLWNSLESAQKSADKHMSKSGPHKRPGSRTSQKTAASSSRSVAHPSSFGSLPSTHPQSVGLGDHHHRPRSQVKSRQSERTNRPISRQATTAGSIEDMMSGLSLPGFDPTMDLKLVAPGEQVPPPHAVGYSDLISPRVQADGLPHAAAGSASDTVGRMGLGTDQGDGGHAISAASADSGDAFD
eukprot:Rmarinus@m.26866